MPWLVGGTTAPGGAGGRAAPQPRALVPRVLVSALGGVACLASCPLCAGVEPRGARARQVPHQCRALPTAVVSEAVGSVQGAVWVQSPSEWVQCFPA